MRLARVRATAYPKLNLSLRVLGRRPDGYHDLESLVVSLGQPHDVLEAFAVPAPGGVRVEVSGVEVGEDVPSDHRNLAFIAAEKLLVRAGRSGHGVRLVLRKHIPAGGGLGGGSADAAAALLAVRRLLDVDVDDAGVLEIASEVGSDVPFCLRGGAAWMRGRGEIVDPVAVPTGLAFVVAIPPFRLSTPDVYKAWDKLGGPRSERVVPAPRRLAPVIDELVNDLEPAAEALQPRLVEFRDALEAATGAPALLAGSGSAYVVPVADARRLPTL
ncbi:MAG TPA: 4-(cytidine 5'-diphospho)-2-C-methyl-D-erythritol kinase, partial [Acidimicrobiia bacterium]|nr:4-(cytidine 5'-diphospho)-2-C-methyl-D-erythritol kinase [Acidimicrobiia bacterium]